MFDDKKGKSRAEKVTGGTGRGTANPPQPGRLWTEAGRGRSAAGESARVTGEWQNGGGESACANTVFQEAHGLYQYFRFFLAFKQSVKPI